MRIQLVSYTDGLPSVTLDSEQLPMSLGRSVHADVTVKDALLSRTHCELSYSDEGIVIRDLESTNGTLVNGRSVSQAVLQPDDTVILGTASFVVTWKTELSELEFPAQTHI